MPRHVVATAVTAVVVLQFASPSGALAQQSQSAREIVESFVTDLRGLGPLTVGYGAIEADDAAGETRLKDLSVVWNLDAMRQSTEAAPDEGDAVEGEVRIEIPEIVFANLRLEGDRYAADRIGFDTVTLVGEASEGEEAGSFRVDGSVFEVVEPVWAKLPEIVYDPARPASSYAPLADWSLSHGFASASFGAIVSTVETEDSSQTTRQEGIRMGTLGDGRLDQYSTGAAVSQMTGTAEVDDVEQPFEMAMTIGEQTVTNLNYAPLMRFLSGTAPASAAAASPGDGDGYETVVESGSADGMTIVSELFSFRLGETSYSGMKIRPMQTSFLETLDGLITGSIDEENSEEMLRFLLGIYGAFAIDVMEVGEMSFEVPDQASGKLGGMTIENFSGDGLGRFGFGGLDVQAPDVSVQLGTFAIGDLTFPSMDDILALQTAGDDTPPDPAAIARVIPQLGLFLLEGISVLTPMAADPVLLKTFRIEQGGFVPLPTRTKWELAGFSLPLAYVDDEEMKGRLAALGADPVRADALLDMAWSEDSQVFRIGPLEVDLPNIGELFFEGDIGGVPKAVFESPMTAQNAIPLLTLGSLQLFYEDKGLVPFAMAEFAGMLGMPVDAVPEMLGAQAEAQLLAALKGNEALALEMAATVQRFLADPRNLKLTAMPPAPVPVAQLLGVAAMAPGTIPQLLNMELESNVAR